MHTQYKITSGRKARIVTTEFTTVGNRISKLQNRILELIGSIRNENMDLIAFLWKDDKGHFWGTYTFHNGDQPKLSNVVVFPFKKENGLLKRNILENGIKSITIERVN